MLNTPTWLTEIEKREKKATPELWIAMLDGSVFSGTVIYTDGENTFGTIVKLEEMDDRPDDLEFIAHSRSDIPRLVSALKDAYALLDRLERKAVKLQDSQLCDKVRLEVSELRRKYGDAEGVK